MLEVANLSVRYDKAMLINDLSMGVDTGELVSLVGPNGAGKSTLLRAITGLVAWEREITRRSTGGDVTIEGTVTFDGERIDLIPAHEIVKRGLIHCPERRRPFREMTVFDNLLAGAYLLREKSEIQDNLDKVYQLFPALKGRANQISGTLSGGEQQMLAIGRALMSRPKLLCIDEPSTGLAPILRVEVFEKIREILSLGITLLLVEQEVSTVFKMATRNYVLSAGKIIAEGTGDQLLQDEVIRRTYLGL
ncbi:MAG: ABC transporter ATP-binding protein [Deltaproteobacteria bacterium]|nr:ABC transporter ATP-binding protein [Deltaproteobacteria bacterium]MBW2032503.1 ABC transporter ATP-binding protein [Deltaproteobacteria bacterium]MBW2113429.1 ABC transporter ATP-binding protein [Deltaproteobacteria bacterium]MBW2357980.1 ABC transporter ATP-binding protein [Deltaproteobacteria bacterium]